LQAVGPLTDGALPALLEVFGAYQKAIQRAAATADRWRYPTPRDVWLANERMSLAPPRYDAERLRRALLLGMLTPPDADAAQRASTLYEALNTLQPFEEYNRSVALLSALAFLQANGFEFKLTPAAAADMLRADQLHIKTQPGAPSPLAYPDIMEALIAHYRDALSRVERAMNTGQLVKLNALPVPARAEWQPAPGPASRWRYLTVQDLIWINTVITGMPQRYNYDRLEEATYYQYSYRQSMDVLLQAARFLWGYLTYRPFAKGNLGTGLIGVLTFLEINGYEVHLPPERAAEWLLSVAQRRKHPLSAIRQIVTLSSPSRKSVPVREVAYHLMERYEMALHYLEDDPTSTPAATPRTSGQL